MALTEESSEERGEDASIAWRPRPVVPLSARPLAEHPGIALAGEIDGSNANGFAELLAGLGPGDAYVDLSSVELMDGSGVRVLLDEARRLRDEGHVLFLISPGYIVRRALSVLTPEELLETIRLVDG